MSSAPLTTELRKYFNYDPKNPITHEGWLQKAKIGLTGARWQRRYFRLQGRCLFYFKKDMGDPPCGYIPLIEIDLPDFVSKGKKAKYQFVIKLGRYIDQQAKVPKRLEYPIMAESEDSFQNWKRILMSRTARWIVGAPYELACSVSTAETDTRVLLPYFLPPFFVKLEQSSELSKRGIWGTDVPQNVLAIGIAALNLNLPLPLDDTQNAIGYVVAFLKALPAPFLPPQEAASLGSPNPAKLREVILRQAAPIRQIIRALILHFNRVLECKAQNKSNDSTFNFFDTILIGDAAVGEGARKCLLANAAEIFDDVHQFASAQSQPVIFRGRLAVNQTGGGGVDDLLVGERGLILNVVRQDAIGWCTVFTANGTVGLVHERYITRLTPEEEREIADAPERDSKLDIVREKLPNMTLLLEAMQAEVAFLKQVVGT